MSMHVPNYQSVNGDAGGPPPPPPPPPSGPAQGIPNSGPEGAPVKPKGWRPSKTLIIISSVILLLVAAAVVALFIILNIIRGGAGSPEQAGEKLIESVNKKDIVGIATMVAPHEREALTRLQSTVLDKFKEYAIAEAIKKVSPEAAATEDSDKFVLDGVEITVTGATPVVTELSDDFALVQIPSGKVNTTIHPDQTKGPLHSALTAAGQTEVIENQFSLADAGPNASGLSLIASKSDGRWYFSPMLSAMEMGNAWAGESNGGSTRGQIPEKLAAGSDSPEDAASTVVRGVVSAINATDASLVAPLLVKDEAAAFYLYGGLWKSSGAASSTSKVTLGDASFTKGPQDGNRSLAFVQKLSLSVGSDEVSITDSCIADPSGEKKCLNGSGYALNYSSPSVNPMALFTVDGKYGLTTVKEDGKWKVSVLDTATDMAVGWVNSLTKEQALALIRVARTDTPSGALTVGKAENVDFNSAGYAVRTLNVDKKQKVMVSSGDGDISTKIYSSDLKTPLTSKGSSSLFSSAGSSDEDYFELEPGSYTVELFASANWQDKFETDGNKVKYAAEVSVATYVEPPTIEGETYQYFGYVMGDGTKSITLNIPEGTTKKLVLTVKNGSSAKNLNLDVEIGGKHYAVSAAEDTKMTIPAPTGAADITANVKLNGSTESYTYVSFDLEFVNK